MASRIGIPILRKYVKEIPEGIASKKAEEKIKSESNKAYIKAKTEYYKMHKYANENYDRLSKNVTPFPDTYLGGKKRRKTRRRKTRRRKTRKNNN
jgi:hypothetical protein